MTDLLRRNSRRTCLKPSQSPAVKDLTSFENLAMEALHSSIFFSFGTSVCIVSMCFFVSVHSTEGFEHVRSWCLKTISVRS